MVRETRTKAIAPARVSTCRKDETAVSSSKKP